MARTLKGTRARGLPPKLLLSQRQDATGSFPTVWRTASDNRTGKYPVFFNDNKVVSFNQPVTDVGIVYPLLMTPEAINAGLSPDNISDLYKQPYFSGSTIVNQPIVASGSMTKGVSDLFVTFTPGQDVEPFMDFANPEGDAKSLPVTSSTYQFYATGSAVPTTGLGFQQPLWSKNKIEIDITPSATQNIVFTNTGSVGNYPLLYWNPNTKHYEGIGNGRGLWSGYGDTGTKENIVRKILDDQLYAFGASIDVGQPLTKEASNIYGRQISTFGFPYHPKFQPTSSQQISMGNYISEPFLLEKIVLELSSSMSVSVAGNSFYGTSSAIWTFFLINSRNELPSRSVGSQNVKYRLSNVSVISTLETSSFTANTYLDLIDYFQLAFTGSYSAYNLQSTNRELAVAPVEISATSPNTFGYTNQTIISSSVKNSLKYDGTGIYAQKYVPTGYSILLSQSLNSSGRNQINPANGRDWRTTIESNQLTGIYATPLAGNLESVETNEKYTKTNPYLLLPTDKLSFGCQLPWSATMGYLDYQATSSIGFANTGINKIILYGSTLRLNPETNQLEEHHDTLNQLLSSNSVHEIIGE